MYYEFLLSNFLIVKWDDGIMGWIRASEQTRVQIPTARKHVGLDACVRSCAPGADAGAFARRGGRGRGRGDGGKACGRDGTRWGVMGRDGTRCDRTRCDAIGRDATRCDRMR